jgi:molybdopterin molybdotransferase
MISYEEALGRLLGSVRKLGTERVALAEARGRVLAEPVTAPGPIPAFDASAMDGYAAALASFEGEGPWSLPVRGESRAGAVPEALVAGAVSRIFTGAQMPPGADTVIMQEDVERAGDTATFRQRPRPGAHLRRAGDDLPAGAVGLEAGTRLGPAQISLAAMLDRGELRVARRPVVAILATGDELRPPGQAGGAASIPESNSAGLAALVAQLGGVARVLPIARDEPDEVARAITEALDGSDLLLTVGGVSVGDHDVVRPSLERAGVTLDFWKVAIKPGKPIALGRSERAHVLGLPGNPVSALVTFALFAAPLLRALQGDARPLAQRGRGLLAAPIDRQPGRLEFLRVALDDSSGSIRVRPLVNQASGAMLALSRCDALAEIPADRGHLAEGEPLSLLRLEDL